MNRMKFNFKKLKPFNSKVMKNLFSDNDRDKVFNVMDCKPFNRKRHGGEAMWGVLKDKNIRLSRNMTPKMKKNVRKYFEKNPELLEKSKNVLFSSMPNERDFIGRYEASYKTTGDFIPGTQQISIVKDTLKQQPTELIDEDGKSVSSKTGHNFLNRLMRHELQHKYDDETLPLQQKIKERDSRARAVMWGDYDLPEERRAIAAEKVIPQRNVYVPVKKREEAFRFVTRPKTKWNVEKAKSHGAIIEWMTPEDYFKEIGFAEKMHKRYWKPMQKFYHDDDEVYKQPMSKLKDKMEQGTPIDVPWISRAFPNEKKPSQQGLHRTLAAQQLGEYQIPVVVGTEEKYISPEFQKEFNKRTGNIYSRYFQKGEYVGDNLRAWSTNENDLRVFEQMVKEKKEEEKRANEQILQEPKQHPIQAYDIHEGYLTDYPPVEGELNVFTGTMNPEKREHGQGENILIKEYNPEKKLVRVESQDIIDKSHKYNPLTGALDVDEEKPDTYFIRIKNEDKGE